MSCRLNLTLFAILLTSSQATVAEQLTTESFDAIHKLIRPSKTESRWLEINWHTDFGNSSRMLSAPSATSSNSLI